MSSLTVDQRLIPQIQYATPVTGATVTANSNGAVRLLIDPTGTLATLTVTFPSSPSDGDTLQLGSSQIVTALTMNGGTIIGGLSSFAVGTAGMWVFSGTGSKWIKIS
jgi:hypothetical protein